MENGPRLKMYLLLKLLMVHCYISLPEDNHVGKKQRSFRKSVVLVEILPTCAINLVFVQPCPLHTSKLFFFFFFINIIYYSFRGLFCKKTLGEKTKKGTISKGKACLPEITHWSEPLILTSWDIQAGIEDADARFNAKKEENEERRIQRENAKVPVTVTWSMRWKKKGPQMGV